MELPKGFETVIGGLTGSSFWIKLVDGILEYRQAKYGYKFGDPEYLEPSARKWANFRKKLDALGIWDWKPTDESSRGSAYNNPDVMDGTVWWLEIDWGDRGLRTSGSNAFPGYPAAPSHMDLSWVAMTGPLIQVTEVAGPFPPHDTVGIRYDLRGEDGEPDLVGLGKPSSAAWYAFSRCLDEIGAWTWDKSYWSKLAPTDLPHLPQWHFTYARGRKRLKSKGYGAYPEGWDRFCSAVADLARDAARPGRSLTAFGEYLHAVRLLIGGRPFS